MVMQFFFGGGGGRWGVGGDKNIIMVFSKLANVGDQYNKPSYEECTWKWC